MSFTELSLLRDKWPPAIFRHMMWLQQDLQAMRADAKKKFRQTRPSPCKYCGKKIIRCDMYRHVTKFHLDLAVSWCTVWKGTSQDCMDHLRGAHDVPWIEKMANMEKFIPLWTVRRQMWSDSLKAGYCVQMGLYVEAPCSAARTDGHVSGHSVVFGWTR